MFKRFIPAIPRAMRASLLFAALIAALIAAGGASAADVTYELKTPGVT